MRLMRLGLGKRSGRLRLSKHAAFAAVALGSAVIAEQWGLHLGLFGAHYAYAQGRMGPMWLGMPLAVPFIWLILLWATHSFVRFTFAPRSRWLLAALGASAMTTLDVALDPWAVAHGYWRWYDGHFLVSGIPLENFAAWFVGTYVVHYLVSFLDSPQLARASTQPLQVRTLEASYDQVPSTWCAGSALLTHFLNAFHIMVAEGERFMIGSMQPVLAEATDPLLRRSLVQFMAQEAQHAKEHRRVHRMLEAQGLRIARFDRVCRFVGRRVLPALFSRRMRIAITSGIEHWTASVGELVLEERWFATADPQMRDIFEWHSAEEIEHRAVAFDALLSFAPGYARRVLGFVFGTAVLLSLSMVGAVDFLLQTRTLFKRTTLRDLARGLSSGAMRRIQLRAMRYLAPRFHPHSGNTSGIAQATLLRLPTRAIAQGA